MLQSAAEGSRKWRPIYPKPGEYPALNQKADGIFAVTGTNPTVADAAMMKVIEGSDAFRALVRQARFDMGYFRSLEELDRSVQEMKGETSKRENERASKPTVPTLIQVYLGDWATIDALVKAYEETEVVRGPVTNIISMLTSEKHKKVEAWARSNDLLSPSDTLRRRDEMVLAFEGNSKGSSVDSKELIVTVLLPRDITQGDTASDDQYHKIVITRDISPRISGPKYFFDLRVGDMIIATEAGASVKCASTLTGDVVGGVRTHVLSIAYGYD